MSRVLGPGLTVAQALRTALTQGLERLDAQLLLLHALGRGTENRAWLIAHDGDVLAPEAEARWQAAVPRRLAGEPLAYIAGMKEFHGLPLHVSPAVLVPRPDTETLVDWGLELMRPRLASAQTGPQAAPHRALDLGTGSGAIALALKQALPALDMTATDASPAALAVAQSNGARLQLPVHWLQGDWLDALASEIAMNSGATHGRPVDSIPQKFMWILSNPPYLDDDDPHLPALRHEPASALKAGAGGLRDLRHIIARAPAHLEPGGWLLLEHGFTQGPAVRALLLAAGFAQVQTRLDLAGLERCSGGRIG